MDQHSHFRPSFASPLPKGSPGDPDVTLQRGDALHDASLFPHYFGLERPNALAHGVPAEFPDIGPSGGKSNTPESVTPLPPVPEARARENRAPNCDELMAHHLPALSDTLIGGATLHDVPPAVEPSTFALELPDLTSDRIVKHVRHAARTAVDGTFDGAIAVQRTLELLREVAFDLTPHHAATIGNVVRDSSPPFVRGDLYALCEHLLQDEKRPTPPMLALCVAMLAREETLVPPVPREEVVKKALCDGIALLDVSSKRILAASLVTVKDVSPVFIELLENFLPGGSDFWRPGEAGAVDPDDKFGTYSNAFPHKLRRWYTDRPKIGEIKDLSPEGLLMGIREVAGSGAPPNAPLAGALLRALREVTHTFDLFHQTEVVQAAGRLLLPEWKLADEVTDRFVVADERDLSSRMYRRMAIGLSGMRIDRFDFAQRLMEAVVMDRIRSADLVPCLTGLACIADRQQFGSAWAASWQRLEDFAESPGKVRSLLLISKFSGLELPPRIDDAARFFDTEREGESRTLSSFERVVSEELTKLHIPHRGTVLVAGVNTDFVLDIKGQRPVALFCDGAKYHYIGGKPDFKRMAFKDLMANATLRRTGRYHVARVLDLDFFSTKDRSSYLIERIRRES